MAERVNPFNGINRGVYIADNLAFLRGINNASVDLVCIDPPFAKNETFGKKKPSDKDPLNPPLSEAERENELRLLRSWGITTPEEAAAKEINWPETRYKDFWSWKDDIQEKWLKDLQQGYPHIAALIELTRHTHSESTAAYLCYISIRLLEIHRILKPTGSLFLHCDHTAGAYLRQLLDTIFGRDNFRNEISWCYAPAGNPPKTNFMRKHDTILFYAKSNANIWNKPFGDMPEKTLRTYNKQDEEGRWYKTHGANRSYLDSVKGRAVPDWWDDIASFGTATGSKERTGYPTQKPVALAERAIKATTNKGDVVLDCFSGCAYVAVAAERLERKWVACDLQPRAWTVFKRQFNKPELALLHCHDLTTGQQVLAEKTVTIHGPDELPELTVPREQHEMPNFKLDDRQYKAPASLIPDNEMMVELLKMSGWRAWCCGFANVKNGKVLETTWQFELDHIHPKSKEGTSHEIENRAPLCPRHNRQKSNKHKPLAEYRNDIAAAGELYVDSLDELVNLTEARAKAMKIYGEAYAKSLMPLQQ